MGSAEQYGVGAAEQGSGAAWGQFSHFSSGAAWGQFSHFSCRRSPLTTKRYAFACLSSMGSVLQQHGVSSSMGSAEQHGVSSPISPAGAHRSQRNVMPSLDGQLSTSAGPHPAGSSMGSVLSFLLQASAAWGQFSHFSCRRTPLTTKRYAFACLSSMESVLPFLPAWGQISHFSCRRTPVTTKRYAFA